MAKKKTATAKHPKKETAEANDSRKPAKAKKAASGIKLKITGGVAWLGWPYRVGQVVEVNDKKQAEEAVNAGRARYVD